MTGVELDEVQGNSENDMFVIPGLSQPVLLNIISWSVKNSLVNFKNL